MAIPPLLASPKAEALSALRSALEARYRPASAPAFVTADDRLIATGFTDLDRALGGGFPRGIIATLEGPAGSGRSAIVARLLATATHHGLGALIESPGSAGGMLYPPALACAGVLLERLLVVPADDAGATGRAADIVLRSGAFGIVVIPTVSLPATAWTRLVSLVHRTDALLIALGLQASHELRYFASLRIDCRSTGVRWAGGAGLYGSLAGLEMRADILKHKRAAPGKSATVRCTTFETYGAPLGNERVTLMKPGTRQGGSRTGGTLGL